jgi:hypothetical protein
MSARGSSYNQRWVLPPGLDLEGGAWLGVSCGGSNSGATLVTTTTTCWQQAVALREGRLV